MRPQGKLTRKEKVVLLIPSLAFAISIVLGKHIVISSARAAGTFENNYITGYSLYDVFALFGITFVFYIVLIGLYFLLTSAESKTARRWISSLVSSYSFAPVNRKTLLICALCFFAAWLPYLIVYWPGFVFGDTANSIKQALGLTQWTNHHPVLFTLLLKLCMKLMTSMSFSKMSGLALFSIAQMLALAVAYSYYVLWIRSRFKLHRIACLVLAVCLAISPYVATYSVALWKDPLFSAGIVLFTLMLADALLDTSRKCLSWQFVVLMGLLAVLVSLMRNNGIFVIGMSLLALLIVIIYRVKRSLRHFEQPNLKSLASALSVAIAVSLLVTGPLYTACGIQKSEMVESVGIALNQMARVAALDGGMSESDREYLNSVLPIEQYKEKYHPCCTDLLKWDEEFNSEALEEGDFWGHWFSMLVKNPVMYFEAWEMQTCGFWAVNVPSVVDYNRNIATGGFQFGDYWDYIHLADNDPSEDTLLHRLLPISNYSIPESMIAWMLIILLFFLYLKGNMRTIAILVPSFALIATLLIASPLWYWPRYGFAIRLLVSLYLIMFLTLGSGNPKKET